MSSKVTRPFCSKTISCRSTWEYERHSQYCKGQNNNLNQYFDNNNNNNEDDMSITSLSNCNDSVLSLTNTLHSSVTENNTEYSSDTDAAFSTKCDDILSTNIDLLILYLLILFQAL